MAQQLKAKDFDVQSGHMLCRQCITAYGNIINVSSSDAELEETPMDDIDEDALVEKRTKCMRHQENISVRVWKQLACLQ